MLLGCNFYKKLVAAQQIWFNSGEQEGKWVKVQAHKSLQLHP